MPGDSSAPWDARLARLRTALTDAALDALVVTRPTNITYLTSFEGSAGAFVLLPDSAWLAVDFRYATAARTAAARHQTTPGSRVDVAIGKAGVDDAVMEIVQRSRPARVGIESQWMSVARFHALARALPNPPPELVPTEHLVERLRVVKDDGEVARLREAGRRLAGVAGKVAALAQPGRTEIEVAHGIDHLLREAGFEPPRVRDDRRRPARTAPCRMPGRPAGGSRSGRGSCWTLGGSTTDTAWI